MKSSCNKLAIQALRAAILVSAALVGDGLRAQVVKTPDAGNRIGKASQFERVIEELKPDEIVSLVNKLGLRKQELLSLLDLQGQGATVAALDPGANLELDPDRITIAAVQTAISHARSPLFKSLSSPERRASEISPEKIITAFLRQAVFLCGTKILYPDTINYFENIIPIFLSQNSKKLNSVGRI